MNERILNGIKWALLIILAVLAFNLTDRYMIVAGGTGAAYKIDKLTGQTWFVAGKQEMVVKPE
jgi:hypothetical protein